MREKLKHSQIKKESWDFVATTSALQKKNTKGNPLGWNEKTLASHWRLYEAVKISSKGKGQI